MDDISIRAPAQPRHWPSPAGMVLTGLPAICPTQYCGGRSHSLAYFCVGRRIGIPASALTSYGNTRRALLDRHGVLLRLRAVEQAKSPREAKAAWHRALSRALAAGRRAG